MVWKIMSSGRHGKVRITLLSMTTSQLEDHHELCLFTFTYGHNYHLNK